MDYGGRGIKVCERWADYANFLKDMGIKPLNSSIDRIDNDGDYSPENCRWATAKEQARNRRTCVSIEHNGTSRTLIEWAEFLNLSYDAFKNRLRRGWSIDRIIETPMNSYTRRTA
jgi:hypothetical protein